uniref:glutaredoxin domain-containing cysteine-rich protein 1-like n=1 Tax=Myxine glutinosa TaxID=7769 RepID=UPI00358E2407
MDEATGAKGDRERRIRITVLSSVSGRVLSRVFEGPGPPEFDPRSRILEGVGGGKCAQVSRVTAFGEGEVGASTTNTSCKRLHILSAKGTVRGVQHKVSTAQVQFSGLAGLAHLENDAFSFELGKIVIYTTSLRVVRATHERCEKVRHVFYTHSVHFEERDVALHGGYGSELIQRQSHNGIDMNERTKMGNGIKEPLNNGQVADKRGHLLSSGRVTCQSTRSSNTTNDSPSPELPAVFINGRYFGNADKILVLNETGDLREVLKMFKVDEAKYPILDKDWTENAICDFCKVIVKSTKTGELARCKRFHGRMKTIVKNKCKDITRSSLRYEPQDVKTFRSRIKEFLHSGGMRRLLLS